MALYFPGGAAGKLIDADKPDLFRPLVPRKACPARLHQRLGVERRIAPRYECDRLAVMNDPEVDDARRDCMAIAAAPYVHARAADAKPGKKAEAEQAARTAERGTSWDQLLQ